MSSSGCSRWLKNGIGYQRLTFTTLFGIILKSSNGVPEKNRRKFVVTSFLAILVKKRKCSNAHGKRIGRYSVEVKRNRKTPMDVKIGIRYYYLGFSIFFDFGSQSSKYRFFNNAYRIQF